MIVANFRKSFLCFLLSLFYGGNVLFQAIPLWQDADIRSFERILSMKSDQKKPFGIIYIVYCGESVSCGTYLRLAAESAKTFRSFSSSLPIAIITSFLGTFNDEKLFTDRVQIPKEIVFPGIQWLTRLLAFKQSPYQITLELDSDTVACGDISPILRKIYERTFGRFDFAVASSSYSMDRDFYPQNGVILYNSSATCFKAIWRNWVRNQNHFENQTNIRDDQYTLGVTLRDKSIAGHRCRWHRLSSSFNLVLGWRYPSSGGKKDWNDNIYWTTLVVSAKVFIVHANGAFTFAKQICALANERENVPRMLTYRNEGPPKWPDKNLRFESYNVSYSVEECKQQLGGQCDPDINFDAPVFLAV